ncbi:hypothetical protein PYCH_02730 [Pyrococcus yayanosii CH1]|uniref:Uncharacterized protein n=1 Tax=Pyrococcus yayanosii (strain CH1 / JCM 16557) TaxID=529709 RepID=F8AGK1_PYRYC|nr:hypothetical protein PYCH_02730 [Pyrococcus yayanosii CH1]
MLAEVECTGGSGTLEIVDLFSGEQVFSTPSTESSQKNLLFLTRVPIMWPILATALFPAF